MFTRILKKPSSSLLLIGPRGTGKSTWIRTHFKDAVAYDLLDTAHAFRKREYIAGGDHALGSRERSCLLARERSSSYVFGENCLAVRKMCETTPASDPAQIPRRTSAKPSFMWTINPRLSFKYSIPRSRLWML